MSNHKDFIQKLEDRLEEVDGKIDVYERKAKKLDAKTRKALDRELSKIRDQKEKLLGTLSQLKSASNGAFNDLRTGALKAFMEMKESFLSARARLNP